MMGESGAVERFAPKRRGDVKTDTSGVEGKSNQEQRNRLWTLPPKPRTSRRKGPHKRNGRALKGPHKRNGRALKGPHEQNGRALNGPHDRSGRALKGPHDRSGRALNGSHHEQLCMNQDGDGNGWCLEWGKPKNLLSALNLEAVNDTQLRESRRSFLKTKNWNLGTIESTANRPSKISGDRVSTDSLTKNHISEVSMESFRHKDGCQQLSGNELICDENPTSNVNLPKYVSVRKSLVDSEVTKALSIIATMLDELCLYFKSEEKIGSLQDSVQNPLEVQSHFQEWLVTDDPSEAGSCIPPCRRYVEREDLVLSLERETVEVAYIRDCHLCGLALPEENFADRNIRLIVTEEKHFCKRLLIGMIKVEFVEENLIVLEEQQHIPLGELEITEEAKCGWETEEPELTSGATGDEEHEDTIPAQHPDNIDNVKVHLKEKKGG